MKGHLIIGQRGVIIITRAISGHEQVRQQYAAFSNYTFYYQYIPVNA